MGRGSILSGRGRATAAAVGAGALLTLLAAVIAVAPRVAVIAAVVMAAGVALSRGERLARRALEVVAVGAGVAAVLVAVAVYPATTLLAALVLGILVLAWRAPALALAAAVLLFEFEGSVKLLLGLDQTPLPGGNRAVGAAALDIALFAAVAGVLVKDRFRIPRASWLSASRPERIAIGVVGGWLALSLLQIVQGGHVSRGLHGFRLFQSYTLIALATLTVFAHPRLRSAAVRGALAIALLVSLYAAVRVAIGPADAERTFALSAPTVTTYGNTVRAIGSFSSAIGLSSFLTPVAVFALVLGFLMARVRLLAWSVALLALVGLIGSYSRTSLFGVGLGVACGLVLLFVAADIPRRRKLAATALVMVSVAGTYGGLLLASEGSPQLRERAKGVLHPLRDESVKLRFKTWRRSLDDAIHHPLGQGLGAVGGASSPVRTRVRTTDNSFLKVLVEQGVLGLVLFAGGLLGVVVVLARRLRRAAVDDRSVGLAALAGFVAFLGISFAGETVEQPGKTAAWGLLGVAAALAFADAGGGASPSNAEAA